MSRVEDWIALAQQNGRDLEVSPALILAFMEDESDGNPHAYRDEPQISGGSIGLMQVLLSTARGLGYTGARGDATELTGLFDPVVNVKYGALEVCDVLREANGDVARAISGYNGGFRPSLGFGSRAVQTVTVCLEHDANGVCVRKYTAKPGQFGNQPYVDKVLASFEKWQTRLAGVEPDASGDVGDTPAASGCAVLMFLPVVGSSLLFLSHL